MKSIWKYPLEIADSQIILMPEGAHLLCVQAQREQLCLWAIVDSNAPREKRMFRIHGTGHELPDDIGNYIYIGTVQQEGGHLVWHVFEVEP